MTMRRLVPAVLILALVLVASTARAETISGRAEVVDGDTVRLEGFGGRIRLYGIDAPESGQTCDDANGKRYLCGSRSAQHLAELVGRNGRLSCEVEDIDRYQRPVAECWTPAGISVNAAMIQAGWAVEFKRYSDGRFAAYEAEARTARRGMWAGEFVLPWLWRNAGDRLPSERVAEGQPNECPIKGNISASGERIFHSPGQRHYGRTRIDESAGEKWFCNADEAEAAGWRAAKG